MADACGGEREFRQEFEHLPCRAERQRTQIDVYLSDAAQKLADDDRTNTYLHSVLLHVLDVGMRAPAREGHQTIKCPPFECGGFLGLGQRTDHYLGVHRVPRGARHAVGSPSRCRCCGGVAEACDSEVAVDRPAMVSGLGAVRIIRCER